MQSLNEGLGQDKIELNKIIMQVRFRCTLCVNMGVKALEHGSDMDEEVSHKKY